jgi:hypothetical protein
MDIAALSVGMSQVKFQQGASIQVMKMALNTVKGQGDMVNQLLSSTTSSMEKSLTPHIGGNIDIRL